MDVLLAQFGALLQSAWEAVQPVISGFWDLAWQDPMHFVAVLIIVCVIIWAAQESARLGK